MNEKDERPFCECGNCDATGRKGVREVRLPMDAWAVAGQGDVNRIAVLSSHAAAFKDEHHVLEAYRGWVAVGASGTESQ